METIGDRIKKLVDAERPNIRAMAEALGVSRGSVYKWMSNEVTPSEEHLRGVAQYFNKDYKYLRDGVTTECQEIDSELLLMILKTVTDEAAKIGMRLTSEQLSLITTAVYRNSAALGHIDRATVSNMLALLER